MKNLINKKFGRLIVIKYIHKNKHRNSFWLCRCSCGKETIVRVDSLNNGGTQSCGCLWKENIKLANTNHGHATRKGESKIYRVWNAMIQRCTNPKNNMYKYYGGRGITICKRWLKFENFLGDMGERPSNRHQLDRINNNLGYYKTNCKWSTTKEQSRNKRNNHLITYGGKTQCIADWAEEYKIPYNILYRRICIDRWLIKKSLLTKPKINVINELSES